MSDVYVVYWVFVDNDYKRPESATQIVGVFKDLDAAYITALRYNVRSYPKDLVKDKHYTRYESFRSRPLLTLKNSELVEFYELQQTIEEHYRMKTEADHYQPGVDSYLVEKTLVRLHPMKAHRV